ncbi:MAG: lytic transglycosylase domain-containing protein [Candidatus Baltobacteraceae bacterium]
MIAPVVLAGLISACAPSVDVRTAAAIVAVESSGSPYAINDNDMKRAYFPGSLAAAKALVRRLAGHQLAVGIAQLDSVNFARLGVDAVTALDPCTNLRLGAQVLVEDYQREYPRASGATEEERRQSALRRAFSAYNSGSPTAAPAYAALVVAATSSVLVRATTAIADAAGGPASRAATRIAPLAAPAPPAALRVAYAPARASSLFIGASSRISGSAFVFGSSR